MKRNSRTFFYNNESGYTLVIVLMIIMVFSILGLSLMATSMNSVKMSTGEREDQSVFYIAEGALNTEMALIEQKINEAYLNNTQEEAFFNSVLIGIEKSNQPTTANFEKSYEHLPKAKITVIELSKNNPREYKVTSTGVIDNKERVVEQEFFVEWKGKGDDNNNVLEGVAISVKNEVLLDGKVTGDIITAKKAAGSITVGWDTVNNYHFNDTIYVPLGNENNAISPLRAGNNFKPKIKVSEKTNEIELPQFPDFPVNLATDWHKQLSPINANTRVLTLTKDYYIPKLNLKDIVSWNGVLKIVLEGSGDKELLIDDLTIDGGTKLLIENKGNSKLKMYVNNKAVITGGAVLNGDPTSTVNEISMEKVTEEHLKKLEIYYKGNLFSVSGHGDMYGSIYLEKGKVEISGTGKVFGNIFSGGEEVSVTGGSSEAHSLIIAPNANFDVSGSGEIQGAIYGKSVEVNGGGKIKYTPLLINNGFFKPGSTGVAEPPSISTKQLIER